MPVLTGTKVNPDKLHHDILVALANMLNHDDCEDPSEVSAAVKEMIAGLSPREVFQKYLEYNGIIGYTHTVIGAINNIDEASS